MSRRASSQSTRDLAKRLGYCQQVESTWRSLGPHSIARKAHWAARKGHVDILQLLLNHGASVNAVDSFGYTPLHAAARQGHVDILQLLLNHGASVNAVDNFGGTPLHYAAREGHVDILQLLLSHGVSVMQWTMLVIHHCTKLHLGVMLISYNCCLAMVPV